MGFFFWPPLLPLSSSSGLTQAFFYHITKIILILYIKWIRHWNAGLSLEDCGGSVAVLLSLWMQKAPVDLVLYPFSDLYAFFFILASSGAASDVSFVSLSQKSFDKFPGKYTICIPLFEAWFWLKLPKPMLSLTLHKFWMGGNKVWNHPLAGDVATNLDRYLWPSVTLQSFNNWICWGFFYKKTEEEEIESAKEVKGYCSLGVHWQAGYTLFFIMIRLHWWSEFYFLIYVTFKRRFWLYTTAADKIYLYHRFLGFIFLQKGLLIKKLLALIFSVSVLKSQYVTQKGTILA